MARSSLLFPPRVLSSSYCRLDVFAHPPFAPVLIIASQQPLKCHPGKVPGTDLSSTRRYFEKGRENCYLSLPLSYSRTLSLSRFSCLSLSHYYEIFSLKLRKSAKMMDLLRNWRCSTMHKFSSSSFITYCDKIIYIGLILTRELLLAQ